MKQNELASFEIFTKSQLIRSKTERHINPSDKNMNSPKFISRRKQKPQIPVNPFSRRKSKIQQTSVFRYLSPKRFKNQDNFSFISQDYDHQRPSDNPSQKSIFDLNFSRINKQRSDQQYQQMSCSKNLFDDMNCSSSQIGVQNIYVDITAQINMNKNIFQGQQKNSISMSTMTDSPQQKKNKQLKEQIQILKEQNTCLWNKNKVLQKQKEQKNYKNQLLQAQIKQYQQKIQRLCFLEELLQNNSLKYESYASKIKQLQNIIQGQKQQIRNWEIIQLNLKKSVIDLQSSLQQQVHKQILSQNLNLEEIKKIQKTIQSKQEQILHLQQQNHQLHILVKQKSQYSKCLQDVILQLNDKIYQLKKSSNENNNPDQYQQLSQQIDLLKQQCDQLNYELQQKSCFIVQMQTIAQKDKQIIKIYENQIQELTQKIQELTIEKQKVQYQLEFLRNLQKKEYKYQIDRQNSMKDLSVAEQYQNEIKTLHNLLFQQKSQRQNLRKQLTYKDLQLSIQKKSIYDHQKLKKQIQTLKNKNKTLMKKINQLSEQNTQLKQKISSNQKQLKKNTNLKKYIDQFKDQIQIEKKNMKGFSKNKKIVNQSIEGTNNQFPKCKCEEEHKSNLKNHLRKNSFQRKSTLNQNSDDQLSFKLSPEKR